MISMICTVSGNGYAYPRVGIDRAVSLPDAEKQSMRGIGVTIASDVLRRLYVDDALSTPEIATKLGCSSGAILRQLRWHGIDVRPPGPVPHSRAAAIGIDWNAQGAYAIGLMATDGNLSGRKGWLSLVSKDLDQIRDASTLSSARGPNLARPDLDGTSSQDSVV